MPKKWFKRVLCTCERAQADFRWFSGSVLLFLGGFRCSLFSTYLCIRVTSLQFCMASEGEGILSLFSRHSGSCGSDGNEECGGWGISRHLSVCVWESWFKIWQHHRKGRISSELIIQNLSCSYVIPCRNVVMCVKYHSLVSVWKRRVWECMKNEQYMLRCDEFCKSYWAQT